jgi:hypothetical protein
MDTTAYGFETLHVDPDSLDATFTTRNGLLIRCRLIQPVDTPLLIGLFSHLSPESRRRRFNLPLENIDSTRVVEEAQRLADVDNRTIGGAILAFAQKPDEDELIGVARRPKPHWLCGTISRARAWARLCYPCLPCWPAVCTSRPSPPLSRPTTKRFLSSCAACICP